MQPNAFVGKSTQPTAEEIAAALGPANPWWKSLVADLTKEHGVDVQEWKSVSPKYGWSLRLKLKKRTIVYLSPHRGSFTAVFILGNKAVQAAQGVSLPPSVVKLISEAKRYTGGTGVRIAVKSAKDVPIVKKLAQIKLAN
jgi:hypothetical protein